MWLIYSTIITSIQKSLRKCSDWITDSVFNHTINISKYNPLAGSNYMKLPKELETPSPPSKKKVWLILKILTLMNALNVFSWDT